jgi:hypothetical protein
MITTEDDAKNAPLPSPLDEVAFDMVLLDEKKTLWVFEDDPYLDHYFGRVYELLFKVREVFDQYYEPDIDKAAICLDIFWQADKILGYAEEHEHGVPLFLAKEYCFIPPEYSDAEILASLAIREVFLALDYLLDIGREFQAEIALMRAPLLVLRNEFPNDYFKEVEKFRRDNWRNEREKLQYATVSESEARRLMSLAYMAVEGYSHPMIEPYAKAYHREMLSQRNANGGKGKQGAKAAHVEAIEAVAQNWKIWTAGAFSRRLANECKLSSDALFAVPGSNWCLRLDAKDICCSCDGKPPVNVQQSALQQILQRAKPRKPNQSADDYVPLNPPQSLRDFRH